MKSMVKPDGTYECMNNLYFLSNGFFVNLKDFKIWSVRVYLIKMFDMLNSLRKLYMFKIDPKQKYPKFPFECAEFNLLGRFICVLRMFWIGVLCTKIKHFLYFVHLYWGVITYRFFQLVN